MPKYIVKPGQRVTHGSEEDAAAHRAKYPGQTLNMIPAVPLATYEEGDELELTEEQAAQMPWAVCTPAEFDEMSSPKAFMARGYSRDEAESMAMSLRSGVDARKAARKPKLAAPQGKDSDKK